jgi:hypothetical protein
MAKNAEKSSFMALFSGSPNRPSTIVCIREQWNHSDLSGSAPRVGRWLGGAWKKGYIELSRTELGLAFDRRSATLEFGALRLSVTLGAFNTPTESCVVSHLPNTERIV